MVTSLTNKVQM